MSRSRPSVPGSGRSLRVITNTTLFPVTCIGFSFSAGDCVGFGGAHYRGAANAAVSLWTGSTGSSIDGFHSLALSILILCSALTPVIRGGSRMRRHARTVLCGGRLAMIVPTATAKHRHYDCLSLLVNWLFAAAAQIGAILLTSQ